MMRRHLFTSVFRKVSPAGFWILVLLALPNCTLDRSGLLAPQNLDRGAGPWDEAIMCDIEKTGGRRCPTAEELAMGIRLSEAAIALNEGRSALFGLDDSPDALARCGGTPELVEFEGPFPQGLLVCLNCSQIGTTYPDVATACRNKCYDFYGETLADRSYLPSVPPVDAVRDFCDANARAATNFPAVGCFLGACSSGVPVDGYPDPRTAPEPVIWRDFIGTTAGGAEGNDLARTAAETGEYDAGAVSEQWITRGDAYVEFSVDDTASSVFLGLTEVPPACPFPCTDTSGSYLTMGFAVMLHNDARYYLLGRGAGIAGAGINESWGDYTPGERFRVTLRDTGDGRARVFYHRVIGACTPGAPCNLELIHEFAGVLPSYPFRVDSSLREAGGTLRDVRVVRIR